MLDFNSGWDKRMLYEDSAGWARLRLPFSEFHATQSGPTPKCLLPKTTNAKPEGPKQNREPIALDIGVRGSVLNVI